MEDKTQIEDQGKTVAIVSYLWIIGWLIAYFGLYPKAKTSLASFHLRQSLLLMILSIAVGIIEVILMFIPVIGLVISGILGLALFILWIIGLIAAIQGEKKPLPLIGEKAQTLFSKL